MKTKIQVPRISFWAILGIAVLLTNLALIHPSFHSQTSTATPGAQTGTAVVPLEAEDEAGSTDGIMIMAVVIVLIVIIPILLKRRAWENGKQIKTTPPS